MEPSFKRKETQSRNKVPAQFVEDLKHKLSEMSAHAKNDNHGCVRNSIVASYQADYYMIGQVINDAVVMIVTADCDMFNRAAAPVNVPSWAMAWNRCR